MLVTQRTRLRVDVAQAAVVRSGLQNDADAREENSAIARAAVPESQMAKALEPRRACCGCSPVTSSNRATDRPDAQAFAVYQFSVTTVVTIGLVNLGLRWIVGVWRWADWKLITLRIRRQHLCRHGDLLQV